MVHLKDAQQTILFSGGENHDFLLSEHVFGGGFVNDLSTFLAANWSKLLRSWPGKPLAHS